MSSKFHQYSGDNSRAFWRRVKRLPDAKKDEAYSLGVALQNHEEFVLRVLANSEQEARSAKRKQGSRTRP